MAAAERRVLVVDNDPDVRDAVCFILENAGFVVVTARSVAEARERLRTEIIHAAVIDVRLQDDKRPSDTTGFDLTREMPPHIPFMVFTGYENLQTVRIALGEVGAKGILSKKRRGAAADLKRYVDAMFAGYVKTNFDLQIEGEPKPETIALQLEIPPARGTASAGPSADDIEEILRVLFHDALAIKLTPLLPPEHAPTVSQAGSVVVQVRPRLNHGWGAAKVVKFGAREEIEGEAERYELFKDYAGGQRLPRQDGVACSRQTGGVTYSLLGSSEGDKRLKVFGQLYAEKDAKDVTGMLRPFFRETFGLLYAGGQEERQDLAQLYAQGLHLTPDKLRNALPDFHPEAIDEPKLHFTGLSGSYTNPYRWLVKDGQFQSLEEVISKCLCHGDLHARNILVDDEGRFWLIDFARVGLSHALRDLVELESDIKFNLLPATDLKLLLPFEQALLEPQQFSLNPAQAAFGDPGIDKAYEVVVALRSLAFELVRPPCDRHEYYLSLLLHTLNVLRLRHIPAEKKEHALLAAALLCERLDQPSSPPTRR